MTSFALYLLESSACLALFYVGFRLFLRKETYFKLNRIYLVCSLFGSLILPAFKITSPFFAVQASVPTSFVSSAPVPVKTLGIGEILLFLYAIGAGVFLVRFIFHMIRLNLIVKTYKMTRINGVKIVSVERDFSPFSFLNFIFINDKIISEHNMRRIIAHEIIHIKQYHTFDILLIELITVFQWFNPFVWPYKKSLQETHEFLADNGVIAQGFSTAKYQLLMFEQHVGVKLFEFANNFKQSQIKRRITMMSKIKSRGPAKLKLLLIVPLAMFLLLAFADPKPAETQVADQKKEEKLKQKDIDKVKAMLMDLKKEEQVLREKMDATEDPKKKEEIKSHLKDILSKEKVLADALANGELPPPPKAPTAPLPPPPPPKDVKNLEQEYKALSDKEEAIRTKMDKVTDTKEKKELKAALVEVIQKQDKIEAYLAEANGANGSNGGDAKIDELKKEYVMLEEKAADLMTQMKSTDNPDKKAKLKQMLSDIQKKQEQIKLKAEAMNAKKNGKKIK
ncbi:M56 family metallopeptidase [Acidobacteriota bacterium]